MNLVHQNKTLFLFDLFPE